MKTETNRKTGEETIEVENGAKKAETTVENPSPIPTSKNVKTEIEQPYRRLEVKTIKTIGACQ